MADNRRAFPATIVKVGKETLRIDLNHPLVGKNVIVPIEVLAVE
jgi:FKBP-type peptidyl-prolyl cis-trans isomerase 2